MASVTPLYTGTTPSNWTTLTEHTYDEILSHHRPSLELMDKVITPIWYIIGFPSNTLAFGVWIRPHMRPSSGCYLAALALGDLVFLALQLIFWLQETWKMRLIHYPVLCEVFPILFMAAQYLSPLLVLGFTVERYISICHPFERDKYCSTRRAVIVICGLVAVSLGLHIVQGYFWQYREEQCLPRDVAVQGGVRSMWTVWTWVTELLVFGIVPISNLVLNLLVIIETRAIQKSEEKRLVNNVGHTSSAATVTLLTVSFYLIITTLPVTLTYTLWFNYPEGPFDLTHEQIVDNKIWQKHFTYKMVKVVIEKLGMSHYATNFFIYVITGKKFRRELKLGFYKMFCKSKLREYRRQQYIKENTMDTSLTANLKINGSANDQIHT